jgi:hypothetical protein
MSVLSMYGETLEGSAPNSNPEIVRMLRKLLEEAEAGRLVAIAGVIGALDEDGKLKIRLWTQTDNWEIHDRMLARVGVLQTFMQNDLIEKMQVIENEDGG